MLMQKFKIGDRVQIKDEDFLRLNADKYCLNSDMISNYHDKRCIIKSTSEEYHNFHTYRIDIDDETYFWCEDTLSYIKPKNNKEIKEIVNDI